MTEWTVNQQTIGEKIVVFNPGKTLDNSNAHQMVEAITEAQNRGYIFIIVDMSDLEFLASAGVGSILGTVEISRETGGDIILCSIQDTVQHVLDVLDLTDYFTITKDPAEAIAKYGE